MIVTWHIILLEADNRRWVYSGHKWIDFVINNTQLYKDDTVNLHSLLPFLYFKLNIAERENKSLIWGSGIHERV